MYVKFIRGTQAKYDQGVSTYSSDGSIFFAEDAHVIYSNGVAYGLSTEAASRIEDLENGLVDMSGYEDDPQTAETNPKTALEKWVENPVVAAENVTIADAGNKITATNVEGALQELATNIAQNKIVNNDVITVGIPTASGTPLSVSVDGVTIDKANSALKSVVKLGYNSTSNEIELQDKNGTKLSSVAASSILGAGIVDTSSYNDATGVLTINFVGGTSTTIDLAKLIDFNDVAVKSGSEDFLTVEGSASESGTQLQYGVKLADVTYTATSGQTPADLTVNTTNGKVLDASDAIPAIKNYVADVLANANTNLAVTAEGDDYVNASVDATTDNKHVVVETNVTTLTATAGTPGTYNATTGAQTTAPTNGTLSGTADSLADAADIASKVKTYVDGAIAIEAARSDAKNKQDLTNLAISADGDGTYIDAAVDGSNNKKINVTGTYGVFNTPTAANNTLSATTNGIAKAEDVATAVNTVVANLDATVGSTTVASNKHVAVQVVETDGKLTGVTVTESDIASAAALTAAQSEIDAIETAVGLNSNGTFTPNSNNNYTDDATSIADAIDQLDTQVKSNADAIEALADDSLTNISVNSVSGTVSDNVASVEIDGTNIKLNKASAQANTLLNPAATGKTAGTLKYGDTVTASLQTLEAQLLWYEA